MIEDSISWQYQVKESKSDQWLLRKLTSKIWVKVTQRLAEKAGFTVKPIFAQTPCTGKYHPSSSSMKNDNKALELTLLPGCT